MTKLPCSKSDRDCQEAKATRKTVDVAGLDTSVPAAAIDQFRCFFRPLRGPPRVSDFHLTPVEVIGVELVHPFPVGTPGCCHLPRILVDRPPRASWLFQQTEHLNINLIAGVREHCRSFAKANEGTRIVSSSEVTSGCPRSRPPGKFIAAHTGQAHLRRVAHQGAPLLYSSRRATMGATPAARRAGM